MLIKIKLDQRKSANVKCKIALNIVSQGLCAKLL